MTQADAVNEALGGMMVGVKAASRVQSPFRPTLQQRLNELRFNVQQKVRDVTGPRKYPYDSQGRPNIATPYLKPVEQYWERPPTYWKELDAIRGNMRNMKPGARIPGTDTPMPITDADLAGWENWWARNNAGRRWSGPPPANWRP